MAQGSYNFGGTAPSFTLGEILLYCLQVTVSNWTCSYISGSGSYTSYSSISTFIADLQSGSLAPPDGPLPTFAPGDSPPDLLVRMPCYVVVLLSSSDQPSLCFKSTPMTTGTDCSSKYFALTETSNGSQENRTVAYFAVPVVASTDQDVIDPYTMFLQYMSGTLVITHSIDPCIKNRGGD